MRVVVTLVVDYDESTVSDSDELLMAIEREVIRGIETGMLTPSGEEVVDSWDINVRDQVE